MLLASPRGSWKTSLPSMASLLPLPPSSFFLPLLTGPVPTLCLLCWVPESGPGLRLRGLSAPRVSPDECMPSTFLWGRMTQIR